MKNNKILILFGVSKLHIGKIKNYNLNRLEEEGKKKNIVVRACTKSDISFKVGNNDIDILINEESINNFSHIIIKSNFTSFKFGYPLLLIAKSKGIITLNYESFMKIMYKYSKLAQLSELGINGLPIGESYLTGSYKRFIENLNDNKIVKPYIGSFGKNIGPANLQTAEFLLNIYQSEQLLLQDKLPNKTDYRILILGDEVLGIMKKEAQGNALITNFSAGGKVTSTKNKDLGDLALKASKVLKCEYAGVDIMYDKNNKPQILEVNRNAGFEGFEKATGINVAKKIIEYLISK